MLKLSESLLLVSISLVRWLMEPTSGFEQASGPNLWSQPQSFVLGYWVSVSSGRNSRSRRTGYMSLGIPESHRHEALVKFVK